MAAPKGHPRWGGRQKGKPNKATIERQRRAMDDLMERARAADPQPWGKDELAALIPEAKELLGVVKGVVARFQRLAMAEGAPDSAWERFKTWVDLYAEVMLKTSQIEYRAADFQSPKMRAIAVLPPPPVPAPKTIEHADNVVDLSDANACSRLYQRRVQAVRR